MLHLLYALVNNMTSFFTLSVPCFECVPGKTEMLAYDSLVSIHYMIE